MLTTPLVAALGCLFMGAVLVRAAGRAVRAKRFGAALLRGLSGALGLALALLAGTIVVGLRGYRALTFEEVAATVQLEPVGRQRFRATIRLPDNRIAMYELAGDAFYLDARILKWHPLVNLLGVPTAYELDRVAGRYNDVADERTKPHTVYALARPQHVDLFFLARRRLLGPLVEAVYGSATFNPATQPVSYEVRVAISGLLMRSATPAPVSP
ncbi:MAG TPA: hypothetical protein VH116_06860 [Gemmatimonadales bacterium]|jgi:hypothetical protein|nr:hypothetical protein [Gemmatimonadales bacterium]